MLLSFLSCIPVLILKVKHSDFLKQIIFLKSINSLLVMLTDYSLNFYTINWMDELGFYVPSTVFQSFRDDGRVNMKGFVQ